MRIIFSAFILLFAAVFVVQPVMAASEKIAIIVNDDAVSYSDITDRMRLIMASSGLPDNPEIRQNIMPQIVGSLIDEQIRLQEAEKLELEVTQGEINAGFENLAQNNNITADQFREALEYRGVNITTLYDQIRSQIAWSKVVQAKLRSQVNVSERDIQNALDRQQASLGKREYLISEIFLPVEDVKEQGQVLGLAQNLVRDMRAQKAPFFRVAQQFSKSAGAAKGGDLGWVQQGQLSPEIDKVLPQTEAGSITAPIRTLSGFHILLLREVRVISEETMPGRDEVRNVLGMQRLENLARRYLQDLKATAFIENRLES